MRYILGFSRQGSSDILEGPGGRGRGFYYRSFYCMIGYKPFVGCGDKLSDLTNGISLSYARKLA